MAKVAKLVVASFITRVVVDDTATYEEIVEAARQGIAAKVDNELFENIEDVIDDKEMPYDPNIELTPEEITKLVTVIFGEMVFDDGTCLIINETRRVTKLKSEAEEYAENEINSGKEVAYVIPEIYTGTIL